MQNTMMAATITWISVFKVIIAWLQLSVTEVNTKAKNKTKKPKQ